MIWEQLFVLAAGIGAGFVGYAVGISSLISYPALLALGIPPVVANATNTFGVIGTGVGGCIGARQELRRQRYRAIRHFLIGAVGGVAGAFLLLKLPSKAFEYVVPPLILFSVIMIALNPSGKAQSKEAAVLANEQLEELRKTGTSAGAGAGAATGTATNSNSNAATPVNTPAARVSGEATPATSHATKPHDPLWLRIGIWAVAIYSGYFGAGAGTCAMAMLSAAKVAPFHEMNALKTVIGTGANITATLVFITQGAIDWNVAVTLLVGSFIGGYIAPPITRHIPARIMRYATVLAGVILAIDLGVKTYL